MVHIASLLKKKWIVVVVIIKEQKVTFTMIQRLGNSNRALWHILILTWSIQNVRVQKIVYDFVIIAYYHIVIDIADIFVER